MRSHDIAWSIAKTETENISEIWGVGRIGRDMTALRCLKMTSFAWMITKAMVSTVLKYFYDDDKNNDINRA